MHEFYMFFHICHLVYQGTRSLLESYHLHILARRAVSFFSPHQIICFIVIKKVEALAFTFASTKATKTYT